MLRRSTDLVPCLLSMAVGEMWAARPDEPAPQPELNQDGMSETVLLRI